MSGAKYIYVNQNGLPGGGPWLILPDCPGVTHNTAFSAKVGTKRPGQEDGARVKCFCPRAVKRLEQQREAAKQRRIQSGERLPDGTPPVSPHPGGRPKGQENAPTYIRNVRPGVRIPDLTLGECRTELGLFIMDQAEVAHFRGGPMKAVRKMCNEDCVVREECAAWPRAAEVPAGSWPGVYGGMTHVERRKAAEAERKEAA